MNIKDVAWVDVKEKLASNDLLIVPLGRRRPTVIIWPWAPRSMWQITSELHSGIDWTAS